MDLNYLNKGITPWFLRGVLILGIAILLGRLGELTIIKGEYYRDLAEGNRIRRVPMAAIRGEIHARGGEILAGNTEIDKGLKFSPNMGFEIVDPSDATSDLKVKKYVRDYTLGSDLGHVTGYLGEISEDELGKVNAGCNEKGVYKPGRLVGRGGLEEVYECTLSGVPGEELFEVDASGDLVRSLGKKPPLAGSNIITNIDYELQKKVSSDMEGKIGAAIVTDSRGEILAMYSSPSFDPNLFVNRDKSKLVAKLLNDKNHPFFNRVISGTYHPGSIFKPLVAIAALEEGKIDSKYTYEDTGKIVVKSGDKDFSYSNWLYTMYGATEGSIGVVRALARSTDTFFYKVGEFLGPDKIADWAEKFGLGEISHVDLPAEAANLIPTPAWKREVKGESWFLGNTYHFAIGQGDLAITPLSINMATLAVATGKLCSPKLVGESECRDIGIHEDNRKTVLKGMMGACSEGGTASVFFNFNPKVACKTGTAQTGVNDKTHAWFTVIAPAEDENPIVMTVLVEEGGEGSIVAAPIAKDVLEYYFTR